ncbi:MAG: biotin transporter BioY [Candidatus Omnitrophota bacterium]
MQKTLSWYLTKKEFIINKTQIRAVGIMFFLTLTVLGAFVYFPLPFTPVPFTLQTFFVLLCGAFLSKKDGVATQAVYLGLGVSGIPLFSALQGGFLKLMGPTGGYIIGFVFAAYVVSSVIDYFRRKNRLEFFPVLFAMSCGMLTIYFFGGLWLSFFVNFSLSQVFLLGVMPFIPGCIVKTVIAALIYSKANAQLKGLFR